MSAAPADWLRHGGDWPNRAVSRFVAAAGLTFHVQVMGAGPPILLLHGTGAATHSWRDLAPLLAARFTVIAPDLPGHGFSGLPPSAQMSPAGVARLVAALLRVLRVAPRLVVGHSAGAAVAAQMVLDRRIAPLAMMSLNGALLPLPGNSSRLFPLAAKLLAGAPVLPWLGAGWASQPDRVAKLLAGTGSRIDAAGLRFYGRVFARPGHVSGTLRLMANWDLASLNLGKLDLPVTLVAGETDGMVPPDCAVTAAALLPHPRVVRLPRLGHLAHEEAPAVIARLIGEMADAHGEMQRQAVPA